MEGGDLNISDGTVSGNTAQSGGSMLYATGGTVTVSGELSAATRLSAATAARFAMAAPAR